MTATETHSIQLRGVRVHNLRDIDVDIPRDALTVITGVSGSGKSSLAFDTLYAEGQRQYIDSLSPYARQFLDQIPRPDVDSIHGLAPTLAIDQKNHAAGGRSTVATVTEVYDYLRLLYARIGVLHCSRCGSEVSRRDASAIVDELSSLAVGTKLSILAPIVRSRRGGHREVLENIVASGLVRVRVDGVMSLVEDVPPLAVRKLHSIDAVVDRLKIKDDGGGPRLAASIDTALKMADGLLTAVIETPDGESREEIFSTAMACVNCGKSFEEVETRTFSYNSPYGACGTCDGVGLIGFTADRRKAAGSGATVCTACDGTRLRPEARAVTVRGRAVTELVAMPIDEAAAWCESLPGELPALQSRIATPITTEVARRLRYLIRVGVDYLSLDRRAETLSGGELQRVRLATNIGGGLVGVCYVLDEPSIGLHPADHDRLIECIDDLRRAGNTVVVVEHDEATIRAADRLIDIGPGAGRHGGRLIANASPGEVELQTDSLTGDYLSGRRRVFEPRERRTSKQTLTIRGVKTHNLDNVTASIPLSTLVGISGVSGSGKSSLIVDTLQPALAAKLGLKAATPGPFKSIAGATKLDKMIVIDQTPIGRNARSCPATYAGVMDEIRKVFATTRLAKTLGFGPGRFSFNSSGGRCEQCKGQGQERIEMNFLSDLLVTCTRCGGRRFNRQTLQARFKGASIGDVLEMSIDEAAEFFENVPAVDRLLRSLQAVGLGYVSLGQSSTTLSGGEAQRIKLGTELARPSTGRTIYFLDEPTTGLHFDDVRRLIDVLQRLVDAGNTVVVIEHQFDLLAACDHVIDLGPGGGAAGGRIVAAGTPEEVAAGEGPTADYLRRTLQSADRAVGV